MSDLTGRVIGAAINVHQHLGPGLLESAYEECLVYELAWHGIAHERQVRLPLEYRGHIVHSYQMDLVVEGQLIVELKAVSEILPIHEAQILTYLRLSKLPLALLMNFNTVLLENGLRRFVHSALACSASSAPLR